MTVERRPHVPKKSAYMTCYERRAMDPKFKLNVDKGETLPNKQTNNTLARGCSNNRSVHRISRLQIRSRQITRHNEKKTHFFYILF